MSINLCITMRQLSVRIGDDLEKAMEDHKEDHKPYEPNDSEIVRAALREYLQEYLEGNSTPQKAMVTAD